MKKLTWFALIIFSVLPSATAQQVHSMASLVERIVREKEPSCTVVRRDVSGRNAEPSEDDTVSLYLKLKDQEVYVGTSNQKTSEAAVAYYLASTSTQITRSGYKLTPDGEKLKRLVDEADFFRNGSPVRIKWGHHLTFDVAFRKGKVVIIVESRKPEIAQKIALDIAAELPPT
jgi:hypothetical protein